ncbi:DUF3365 domain-containing protein [Gilvimarinus agarilyticus]|uniref:Tll0287-like domain-containing protein n=1 Tax=Gilvimarinus sp. 2_MG-2023 TaxID=3062666 RepID=UPI001C0A43ED|nr:DUF3365 domain-containing protein [Gilvimarinus sp. 2_MG-2023]MBU2886554.1 DUF3365 domain-containing protein [Gilvimarinus agarilyticus]MDO6571222.1 DUF3365 domain-containing protein [Gilvimarinus sp. 2_MG-2023]
MLNATIKLTGTAIALLLAAQLAATESENTAAMESARQATYALQKQLGSRLQQAIAEGGLEQGVQVCAQQAPRIAEQISAEFGKSVGRTALRVRNSANQPDQKQQEVLQLFAEQINRKKDPAQLESLVQLENGTHLYMRPIVMQGQCLACHGNINDDLRAQIYRHYPADQATGFQAGELRGAFVVTW